MVFCASCAGGAALSEAIGSVFDRLGAPWMMAGAAGAVVASLWNYTAAKNATWRREGPAIADLARGPQASGEPLG